MTPDNVMLLAVGALIGAYLNKTKPRACPRTCCIPHARTRNDDHPTAPWRPGLTAPDRRGTLPPMI